MPSNRFTKTEALRRLRVLAAEARDATHNSSRAPAEVGLRTRPVVSPTVPTHRGCYHPEDDLSHHASFREAATDPEVATHGAVVHIYIDRCLKFMGGAPEYELDSVVVGWMGTPDTEPVLIDCNGSPRPGIDRGEAATVQPA